MSSNSRPAAPGPSAPHKTQAPDFPQSPAASAAPLVLFAAPPRDYSRFRRKDADLANPWLVYARHQARLHGEAHGWTTQMRRCPDRGLIAVLSGHASGERIRRSDLATSERTNKIFGPRLADILDLLGLLNDDRLPALDTWITTTTRGLTPGIRDDVHHWLTSIPGQVIELRFSRVVVIVAGIGTAGCARPTRGWGLPGRRTRRR